MAKTIALSPDSKSRLRKEILEGIGQPSAATPNVRPVAIKPVVKPVAIPAEVSAPAKSATKTVKVASKRATTPAGKTAARTKSTKKSTTRTTKSKATKSATVAKKSPATPVSRQTKRSTAKKSTRTKKSTTPSVQASSAVAPRITPDSTVTPLGRPLTVVKSDNFGRPLTAISRGKVGATTSVTPAKMLALPAPFHRVRRMVIGFVVFAALMLIVATATATVGLYRFGWHDRFSQAVAQYLNLPAGTINGQTISLAQYISDSKTIAKAVSEQREGIGAPIVGHDDVFNRLASVALIISELKRYNITISNDDIDRDLQAIVAQFQDRQAAADAIFKIYNLSIEDFRDKILVAVKARDLLQQQITKDESLPINQAAKTEAEAVLRLAQDPTVNFSLLAQQYTQDETGVNTGGDLGWVTKGKNELPTEIENIIFGLSASSTHPTLVKSDLGYHIIRVDDRSTDPETGAETAHARHIMIKVNVDEYIKSLFDQADIVRYIR